MDGFLGLPMRMQETADLFRGKGVDGERVRNRPGIERLLLGHCGDVSRHVYLFSPKEKQNLKITFHLFDGTEKEIKIKIYFYKLQKE